MSKNVENRQPVRVVRGFKLNSGYAPGEGYRYDGEWDLRQKPEANILTSFGTGESAGYFKVLRLSWMARKIDGSIHQSVKRNQPIQSI